MFCSQFDTNLALIPWTRYSKESFEAFFAFHLLQGSHSAKNQTKVNIFTYQQKRANLLMGNQKK